MAVLFPVEQHSERLIPLLYSLLADATATFLLGEKHQTVGHRVNLGEQRNTIFTRPVVSSIVFDHLLTVTQL